MNKKGTNLVTSPLFLDPHSINLATTHAKNNPRPNISYYLLISGLHYPCLRVYNFMLSAFSINERQISSLWRGLFDRDWVPLLTEIWKHWKLNGNTINKEAKYIWGIWSVFFFSMFLLWTLLNILFHSGCRNVAKWSYGQPWDKNCYL